MMQRTPREEVTGVVHQSPRSIRREELKEMWRRSKEREKKK
jgi:hypothetical protein